MSPVESRSLIFRIKGRIFSLEQIKPLQLPNKFIKIHLRRVTEDEKGATKNIAASLKMSLTVAAREDSDQLFSRSKHHGNYGPSIFNEC